MERENGDPAGRGPGVDKGEEGIAREIGPRQVIRGSSGCFFSCE